jgi:hypothetical protein
LVTLVEPGAGDEVIMRIAGHVSRAMLSRYFHACGWRRSGALSMKSPHASALATGPSGSLCFYAGSEASSMESRESSEACAQIDGLKNQTFWEKTELKDRSAAG